MFSQEECSASEDCLAVLDEMIGGYDVVDVCLSLCLLEFRPRGANGTGEGCKGLLEIE